MDYQAVSPPNYSMPLVNFMGPAQAMRNAAGQQQQQRNATPGQPQTVPRPPGPPGAPLNLQPQAVAGQRGQPMPLLPQGAMSPNPTMPSWASPFMRFMPQRGPGSVGMGGPMTGTSPQPPATLGFNPQVPSGWAGLY